MRGEQRRRFLHWSEVPAVAVAVGDEHVQELAGLVAGPVGVQDTGHLGQPGLQGCGETAVTLDDPEARRRRRGSLSSGIRTPVSATGPGTRGVRSRSSRTLPG